MFVESNRIVVLLNMFVDISLMLKIWIIEIVHKPTKEYFLDKIVIQFCCFCINFQINY